jgi:signal peptidase II
MGKAARWALLPLVMCLVGCDHATKTVAKSTLGTGKVITLIGGWLDLRYTENFDTAFSLTRGWTGPSKAIALLLVALATAVALLFVAWSRRQRASTAEQVAFALLAAGAIGNTLDRARRGYVIDFIHLHHWPVFNVADILVVAGIALLGLTARARAPTWL